jgi:hypothetical protein
LSLGEELKQIEDKIFISKELGMIDLNEKELLELEEHSFKIGQILEEEYLYYNEERNINFRTGLISEETDNISHINQEPLAKAEVMSEVSEHLNLMNEGDEGSSSSDYTLNLPTDFIIVLNFLLNQNGGILISTDYLQIHKQLLFTTFLQEFYLYRRRSLSVRRSTTIHWPSSTGILSISLH